jgi:hypothetical protein
MSFRRRTSETIAGLQRELEALKADLAQASAKLDAPPAEPPPMEPPVPGASLSDVQDAVRELTERLDGLDRRQLGDHESIRLRLEELTVQFTNQLVEMGHELDGTHQLVTSQLAAQEQRLEELAATANGQPATAEPALIEELRANQVRIANDLARHQIAMKQDLSAFAELINRTRRST